MGDESSLMVPLSGNESWREIVEKILDELADGDLPDDVIEATELILAGYPTYKIAEKLGVKSQTVRSWMSKYPTMAAAIAQGKKSLSLWRMSKLEQQFLTAIDRSREILEVPLHGEVAGCKVDSKVLTVVAAQARYIIGLFAGQKTDITVTHELGDTVLKAKDDALDYIAKRLAEQQHEAANGEPIEIEYKVIDERVDDSGPLLDEDGNPPFGEIGKVDVDEDGILCHICGRRYKSLAKHITTKHNTPINEYETLYMLAPGSIRDAEGYE